MFIIKLSHAENDQNFTVHYFYNIVCQLQIIQSNYYQIL